MRVVMVSDVYFPRVNGVSTAIQTYHQALLPAWRRRAAGGAETTAARAPTMRTVDHPRPARPVPGDPEDRLVRWGECTMRSRPSSPQGAISSMCRRLRRPLRGLCHGQRYGVPVIATYHTLFEEYLASTMSRWLPASWLRGLARRFSRRQCNALMR